MTSEDQGQVERSFLLALLELSQHEDPRALLDEALQLAVEVSHANHGYIEIDGLHGDETTRFSATSDGLDPATVKSLLSSTIMRTALSEGRTIATRTAFSDARFAGAPSVKGMRIDAVVCVPLGSKPLAGVLYLQGTSDGQPFPPNVVGLCEIFARHLATIAPALVRKLVQSGEDPTLKWRAKLEGSDALIGSSRALAELLKTAASAAPRDIGVLITGPSGSGKSVLAALIASNGPRARGPFVALNCANIESNLLESELFGAMQGAHSTANRRILGKVEAADKGTLFLDEIAELSATAQSKLLQFLQDGTFFPLGGAKAKRSDVRVIAATNANLLDRVRLGTFREDLYYRLCVIELVVPPLDERRIDIAPMAERFALEAASRLGLPSRRLSLRAAMALEAAEWPGHVRQLKNTVEAAAVRADSDESVAIEAAHVFPTMSVEGQRTDYHALIREMQRKIISDALVTHNWNVSEAANAIGLGRSSLYQLIKSLGLERT